MRTLSTVLLWLILTGSAMAQGLDVQPKAKIYEPIVVNHDSGVQIQILPWGTPLPEFLNEDHIRRFDTHTVWCAPPGAYLVTGMGDLKIVLVEGVGPPVPPGPTPPPGPGPNPPPGPTPPPGPSPEPSLPSDKFDDLARRIDKAANEANVQRDLRFRLAEKFLEVSNMLKELKIQTIPEAAAIIDKAEQELGTKSQAWKSVRDIYVKDGIARTPMSWETATEWYRVVGIGLKGAQ